jgi:hypothetical protein
MPITPETRHLNPPEVHSLAALRVQRWRFELTSLGMQWSGFPGALLHSGLGMMLARVAPDVFAPLYGPTQTDGPRPWCLQPPLDSRVAYAPQDALSLELVFFNPEAQWVQACAQALDALGRAGIGKQRGRFALREVEPVVWKTGEEPWPHAASATVVAARDHEVASAGSLTLADMLASASPAQPTRHVSLQLLTPLRLKAAQGYVTGAPSAELLLSRLLARVSMLCGISARALPLAQQAMDEARAMRLAEENLVWDDLTRYSARQRAEMPLGGLTGWLGYTGRGTADAAFAWLSVGEWLQLGARTTFGLGVYRLVPARAA